MPTKVRDDFLANVNSKIGFRDSFSQFTEADLIQALNDAVDFYSKDNPQESIYTIVGDGGFRYALPSDWNDGFSSILHVEYPVGEQDPLLLDVEEVVIWKDDEGEKFQFRTQSISTDDEAWVRYTHRHVLNDDGNTIPDSHFEAVCFLATAFASLQIAGRLMKPRGASSEFVNFRTASDEYKAYSKEMLMRYFKRMGIDPDKGQRALLTIFDLDMEAPSGLPWLTHSNR